MPMPMPSDDPLRPPAAPSPALPASPIAAGATVYARVLEGSGGRPVEALQRGGDRSALAAALYASPPYDVQVPPLPVARLSINLSHAPVHGGLDGERPRAYLAPRHSLFLTPAAVGAAWRKAAPSRHINLYFHAELLQDDGDGAWPPGPSPDAPLLDARLAGGQPLIDALAAELAGSEPFAAEAVDSLARLLLVRLARQRGRARAGANPLGEPVLARLREFVAEHLEQRLLVADLAAVAGLSPNRFAQAFTARTGSSPHQFVLEQRLARATALLRQRALPLAEVAAACGFASQQHLTMVMRRRLGTTPARYRAGATQ